MERLTWLLGTLDDEVVDHDSYIAVCTGEYEWRATLCRKTCIDPCYDTLCSSFFVSRSAVDLPGKK